ncbi:MAG TPA: HAD hydrolase-like protein [Spirochaetia bacterium]|nr:HAD hydrolase-like protein [Spirochaetia bacterium]
MSAIGPDAIRVPCLLIDHDDTAVDSMSAVHYPAHLEALATLRPGRAAPTKEQFLLYNFHGIMNYMVGELALNEAELMLEFQIWRRWTTSRVPPFFPGFLDVLEEYRGRGGKVVVISHSEKDVIEGHYRAAKDPPFIPDLVFGWDHDANHRKPSPWPVQEALRLLGFAPNQALILDDLKPGVLMSHATGVPAAGAGWSHRVPEIETYMRANTVAYFSRIEDLRSFLLSPT